MALVGVQALALAVKKSKGTISKHAAAGKIPVAARDERGNPLFDVDQVRAVYEKNINPLMRRSGDEVEAPASGLDLIGDDDQPEDDPAERRSPAGAPPPRAGSSLLKQQTLERQLRNRRLLRQIAADEGLFILKSVAESDQTTFARRTRDGLTSKMADCASALSSFVNQRPRTEAELRVWLNEHTTRACDEVARDLAAENEDEFSDANVDDDAGAEQSGQSFAPAAA